MAAFSSYQLAIEIVKINGIEKAKQVINRHDALSIEIDLVVDALKKENRKPSPALFGKNSRSVVGNQIVIVQHGGLSQMRKRVSQ